MEESGMTIWRDIGVLYRAKEVHANTRRKGRRLAFRGHGAVRSFAVFMGEIPVVRFNDATGKCEDVVNNRGRAYGARKRQMYRSNKKRNAKCNGRDE